MAGPLSTNTVTKSTAGGRFANISNPYAVLPRQRTFWDKLLNALGMRSGYDKAQEQYNLAGAEYNAQLEQLASEEQYNDPAEQAARMRAAGLNPDLQGLGNVSPASEFDNQQESPDVSVSSDAQQNVLAFADGIMNIFTTSLGLASSIQGVARNKIENGILRLTNESSMTDFASKIFPYLIPETSQTGEDGTTPSGHFRDLADIFMGGMPKSMTDRFYRNIMAFWNSAPGSKEAYDSWKSRIASKKSYELESNTFFDRESDLVLDIITDELSKLNEKIIKSGMEANLAANEASLAQSDASVSQAGAVKAQAANNEAYFNSLDSSLQAQSENASNQFNLTNMQMNETLNASIKDIIDRLEAASQERGIGGGLSRIAMALLASFRLMITTQGMPSFSRSSNSFSNDSYSSSNARSSFSW